MNGIHFFLLSALLGVSAPAYADDTAFWMSQSIRNKLNKKVWLEARQHLRLDNNVSRIESVFPEFRLDYKVMTGVKLSAGYRLIAEVDKSNAYEIAHRYHVDAAVKTASGPVELKYRLRYQEKHEQDEFDFSTVFRNRVMAVFKVKKTRLKPGLGFEVFTNIFEPHKYRLTAFAAYKINKQNRLRLRFHRENGFGIEDASHIIAFDYQFKSQISKKKPKQVPKGKAKGLP